MGKRRSPSMEFLILAVFLTLTMEAQHILVVEVVVAVAATKFCKHFVAKSP